MSFHIPITVWLQNIDLLQYEHIFKNYKGVEDILSLTQKEILYMGVQNAVHQARIITSLKALASKIKQSEEDNSKRQESDRKISNEKLRQLQTELEAELRLPVSELASHAWFHGTLPRQEAEQLLTENGQFLVRESISQQGSYVLSCRHNGSVLHFVINKFINASGKYATPEYGFEGSRYSTVPALIMSHVGDGRVITVSSQAKILTPANRSLPLLCNDKYKQAQRKQSFDNALNQRVPITASQVWSAGSQPALNKSDSVTLLKENVPQIAANSLDRLRSSSQLRETTPARGTDFLLHVAPVSSLPLKAHSESDLRDSYTHKPHRSTEIKYSKTEHPSISVRNPQLYDDGPDYSDYDEIKRMPSSSSTPPLGAVQSSTNDSSGLSSSQSVNGLKSLKQSNLSGSGAQHQSVTSLQRSVNRSPLSDKSVEKQNRSHPNLARLKQPSQSSVGDIADGAFQKSFTDSDDSEVRMDYDTPAAEAIDIRRFTTPIIPAMYLDVNGFHSDLIAANNKPLDPGCMFKLKEALFQVNQKVISQHITYLDLHLLKVTNRSTIGAGITSGIEALTLPQGKHFRDAAIERHCSLKYVVAVTVLASTNDLVERSQMLKQWILIASELLRTHGNVFGFASVVEGLFLPAISRLTMTWNFLERREPVVMNLWKTRLSSTFKELSLAGSSLPVGNMCIPHILPICEILERDELTVFSWEQYDSEFGLDIMLAHMDIARVMTSQTAQYSSKGAQILQYFTPRADLRDLMKAELHMRLLYGHKGALANRVERRQKFEQILAILSKRAENNDVGTEL